MADVGLWGDVLGIFTEKGLFEIGGDLNKMRTQVL